MGWNSNDSTVPHQRPETTTAHDYASALSRQVNIMERLQLVDPSKQTTSQLMQNDWIHMPPLDQKSAMNDPHKFFATADKMIANAPGNSLNFDSLKQIQASRTAPEDERNVAKSLSAAYMGLSTDNPHSFERFLTYVGVDISRVVREDGLAAYKKEQFAADSFAKHPELTGPQSLAYAFKNIFENGGYRAHAGFSQGDLSEIAQSPKYTNQERAAAELVRTNFSKFATLGDKDATTFSINDLAGVANIGMPENMKITTGTCEKTNVAGNTADAAVTVGLVSKALGSHQSAKNALVAAATAAIVSEIANKSNCADK